VTESVLGILTEGRRREKGQTLFYRRLAGEAEDRGDSGLADRMNDLLADEQHHLSRLTARVLELGGEPEDLQVESPKVPSVAEWEEEARRREEDEMEWYREALRLELDPDTRSLLQEIMESERHHAEDLGGKWMSA